MAMAAFKTPEHCNKNDTNKVKTSAKLLLETPTLNTVMLISTGQQAMANYEAFPVR